MPEKDRIDEWLQRLRSGATGDFGELDSELLSAVRDRAGERGAKFTEAELLAGLDLARTELDRFKGTTEADLLDWIASLTSLSKSRPAGGDDGSEADETLVKSGGDDGADDTSVKLAANNADETWAKPAPRREAFSLTAAIDKMDDFLSWRFEKRWPLSRIAEQLNCTTDEAAAVLRLGLQRHFADPLDRDAVRVLPIDTEFAKLLEQIDKGQLIDREKLSLDLPESTAELTQVLDRLDRYEQETIHSNQTLVVESGGAAQQNGEGKAAAPRGQMFGDYELLEIVAKGGMGVVHKALQAKLNRVVAIKTILAGQFADKQDVDRFYAEAESAAHLRHPNIVSIHEIGEHQGQHFFSMDFIDGQSLADMVRENAMPVRQAAEYSMAIAEAMQYAHDQGILHRDLKPANILVDHENTPLISDFGLAKQVDGQSQLTIDGTILGTPSYMPPEQASGQLDNVDQRSDVYSLGAILFELLTGSPPFRSSSPFETIRQVLETEPVSPRMLNSNVPADLETICLKCLQKERAKRFQSSQELADELKRYLGGEPILSRPVGRLERVRRWCYRNPKMATLAGTTILAFLAIFVTVTVAYFKTTTALANEKIARADAEESFQQARQAVDEFYTTVSEDTLLNRYGMQPIRRALLKKALDYYQQFLEQRRDDPTIADEVAMTFYRVGFISDQMGSRDEAIASFQHARAIQEKLVAKTPNDASRLHALSDTLVDIARIQLDSDEETERLQKRVIELREQMVSVDRSNAEFARELANGHMNLGILYRERAKRSQGESAAAERAGGKPRAEQLAKAGREQHSRAVEEYEKAQTIRREFIGKKSGQNKKVVMNYAMGFFNLGQAAADILDIEAAEKNYKLAIDEFRSLQDDSKPDFVTDLNLATCHRVLADHYSKHGADGKARENYEIAEGILTPLAFRNPDELNFRRALADTYKNRGQAQFERGERKEALRLLGQALELEKALTERNPELSRDRNSFHDTTIAFAQYHLELNNPNEAIAALRSLQTFYSKAIQGPLIEYPGERKKAQTRQVDVSIILGDVCVSENQLAAALEAYEAALKILLLSVDSGNDLTRSRADYATTSLQASQIAYDLKQESKARGLLQEGMRVLDLLRARNAGEAWFKELDEFATALKAADPD
jgi:tetratricopeptide (TPR) repeat protein/predicted Ser/Thr protein kinase